MINNSEKYVLISVFNKKGLAKFAKILHKLGFKLLTTEGSGNELKKNRIPFIPCQKISKNPDSFGGSIKTISFQIESGILFDRLNPSHVKDAKRLGIKSINIVICNFYPFEEAVKNSDGDLEKSIENIDFGGPTMVSAAAKNFKHVLVIVDPNDYVKVSRALFNNRIENKFKQQLAAKAFTYIYKYDFKIAKFLKKIK